MTQTGSHVTSVLTGPEALSTLARAVDQAQVEDRFARLVVITDHHDVAGSVRHWLGGTGLINVTVQTGGHLADELNQSQGGMCICRVLGIGAGVSRECFGP